MMFPRLPFMRAERLPIVNTCHLLPTQRLHGGLYNCTSGTWLPSNSTCCPRGGKENCNNTCAALLVDDPTFDKGHNEATVLASGLPLQIVYGDTSYGMNLSIQHGEPLLTYHWEPTLMSKKFTLLRVWMHDDLACDEGITDSVLPETCV